MRIALALAAALFIGAVNAAQVSQPPANFEGKWRLVATGASPDAANTILVSQSATPFVTLERGYPAGVKPENYSFDPARRGFYAATWMGSSLVLNRTINNPTGRQTRPASGSLHRETWTLLPGDVLNIDVTDQPTALGAAVTSHLTYKRVPLPDAIVPGGNLLENPDATSSVSEWHVQGDAKVEPCGADPCFVLRNHGVLMQTILLPAGAGGKYIVLIGSATTERINPDGAITGQPHLHGVIAIPGTGKTLTHLQGQQMAGRLRSANEWVTLSGVFEVPARAIRLSLTLNQSEARGTPQDGSATRFDQMGVFLFPTKADADIFVSTWKGRE